MNLPRSETIKWHIKWPLGSSAPILEEKGCTSNQPTSVGKGKGFSGNNGELFGFPLLPQDLLPRVLRNSFTPILAVHFCTCNLALLWSIYSH